VFQALDRMGSTQVRRIWSFWITLALIELLLCSPGKAHRSRGPQHTSGMDLRIRFIKSLRPESIGSPHGLEDAVIDVLGWDIQVMDDLLALG